MTEERELRKEIIELLVGLPAVHDPNGRRAILLRSGLDEVLPKIDCTGAPSDFATRIVVQLYQFGSLQRGQHALDALLECLKNHVGLDRQAEIEVLRERLRTHLADLEALGLKSYIGTDGDFVSVEEIQKSVYQFLEAIKNEFKYVPIFHPPHKIVLQDQYIPIEVTLERRYRHAVETTWGYAEGEAEFARAYAMKGFEEQKEEEQKEETHRVQVPWQEAKQKHKRIIVLADPGMGKTALLKMEAMKTAQKSLFDVEKDNPPVTPVTLSGVEGEVEVPLFFRLSEFADTDEEIADTIPRLLQRNYPDIAPTILPLLAEKLKNGTCLLLLDALDEVPQEQRNPLANKLNRFARHFSCPIIITSRIVGYGGGILHDAKEVEIVPFTRKQIDQYIEIWFKNLELDRMNRMNRIEEDRNNPVYPVHPVKTPDAKGLIHELQQKPQIRGLTQNPLLLSLLCSLYQEDELTLPARRVQIYEQAVQYMLYDWRRVSERRLTEQTLTDAAWIEAKLELLEHLAYQFSCEYKEIFSMRELLTQIEECTGGTVLKHHNAPDIIKELSQEDGIIQQLDGQGHNTRYIFLHRTFQEYLTASYLNRQSNAIELAKAHFWDFDWHETLILFAGLADDPRLFLNTLLAERDDIFHTLLLLAGKCLAECPPLEMPQLVDRLYTVWRLPLYREFVEPTVVVVGQTHQQILMYLLAALHDPDRDVRKQAVAALGAIGNARAVEGLLAAFHDPDKFVRGDAARALGKIGDAWAVDELLAALRDPDKWVREVAAEELGQTGGVRAVEGLLAALHDPDRDVRGEAAKALGQIGDPRAIEDLLAALHDTDECVRESVMKVLGQFDDQRVIESLFVIFHDATERIYIRKEAAKTLGQIGIPRAIKFLLNVLHNAGWNDKLWAVEALKRIGSLQTLEGLLVALHDEEDDYIRGEVANALGQFEDPRAIESLCTTIHDTNWFVRQEAARALGKLGTVQAVESLLAVLQDTDKWVRMMVASALGQIGDSWAVEDLFVALHDTDKGVRQQAAKALGQIGDSRAVESLLTALHDTDKVVRMLSAEALGVIGNARAVEGLLAAFHDPHKFVRGQAAWALGKIGTLDVLEKLLHRLDIDIYDKHIFPVVRQLAIKFSRMQPQPACLPVYPQHRLIRWLRKRLWLGKIRLNELRRKRR